MLSKVIGVGGRKGGSGKTTLSCVVATGIGALCRLGDHEGLTPDTLVSLMVTDPDSEVPSADGRLFEAVKSATAANQDAVLKALHSAEESIALVIDSAARQVDLDIRLVKGADLFLLPITPDDDAAVKAVKDLLHYRECGVEESAIWIVPNKWDSNPTLRAEAEQRLFEGLAAWDGGRGWKNIMSPVFHRPSISRLTRLDDPNAKRDQLRFCVDFTRDVLKVVAGEYQPYSGVVSE